MTWRPFGGRSARPRAGPPPNQVPQPHLEPAAQADPEEPVEWIVNRCPACGSSHIRVRKTTQTEEATLRLCRCSECLHTWKASQRKD